MEIDFTLFSTVETVTFPVELDGLCSCRFALSWCANTRFSQLSFQSVVLIFLTVTMDFVKTCITIFIKERCKMIVSNSLTIVNEFRYAIFDGM